MSIVRLFALAILLLTAVAPLASTAARDDNRIPANSEQVELVTVIDGDTFDLSTEDGAAARVRLIGVDTPERGECFHDEARAELRRLYLAGELQRVEGPAGADQ